MLKKLRVKIVAIVVGISVLVLALAFAAIMASTWSSACGPLKHEMKAALERGTDEEAVLVIGRRGPSPAGDSAPSSKDDTWGEEASFTPVAVASVDDSGAVVAYNATFLYMDETVRTDAVAAALAGDADTGLLKDAGVLYLRRMDSYGTTSVAFVDASALVSTVSTTATSVAGVFACALVVLVAVSIVLSRIVTRPVQRAWEQQGEFVADASHELKTPLTVILANADILQAHPDELSAEQSKWVASIGSEARRMKGLVEEMLFLARSDSEGGPARPEEEAPEVDLADVVRQSCLSFDAVAFEVGVTIVEDGIANEAPVHGERGKLERLANILVDNAVKYAGTGGEVHVLLAVKKRGHAVFSVRNTGTPIPPEDLPRVFDRFWRSDRARTAPDAANASFGLGLAIAKSIAEEAGGHISVASDEANGTTFTVNL